MNILLTGSNGFIGSYFKNTYKNKYNISIFSFLNDNLKDLNLSNTNVIIHLSALVHKMGGASERDYERINVQQTLDLAFMAKNAGVSHFIFMSTIAVYGINTGVINENLDCNPITNYGKSKLEAERKLNKFNCDKFKISIIRPPIVSGYNAPGNMKSLINLVKKTPLLPFGKINNKRSMVYVGNLCHLIDEIIIQKKAGVFLACDDNSLSTSELIDGIAVELKTTMYLFKIPFFGLMLNSIKPTHYKRLFASLEVNNTITKKSLNLINPYSVHDGLRFMVKGE